jgi:imidazolonepropionase-like amidohydrolase
MAFPAMPVYDCALTLAMITMAGDPENFREGANMIKEFTACLFGAIFIISPVIAAPVYLTADHMVDPVSGRVIENPAIVIDEGKIVSVGRRGELAAPEGAQIIDLSGQTILPGFIDMHTHLTGSATKGRGYAGLGISKDRHTIWGVVNAEKTLMAGFTTVRNVGSEGYETVALRDSINDSEIPGPRMFVVGPPVGIVGGHCSDNNLLPPEYKATGVGVASGPWEMRAKVRQNIKYGVDWIKTCSTGGVLSKATKLSASQGTIEELTAIADEAHSRGVKVASHAHGTVGIKNAIRAGIDTIEHASYLDDEAIRMAKRKGVYLSMDIYNTEFTLAEGEKYGVLQESLEKERAVGAIQRESFTKAVKAGAKVVFGSDAAVYPHGDNAKQFSRMVEFGMTPIQAIQAATSLAAEALGKDGELGCLSEGCTADIVAVSGDPIGDISVLESIDFVMKNGTVYKD